MSRLAKKPITVPQGVSVTSVGNDWVFKGPNGELKKTFPKQVNVEIQNGKITLSLKNEGAKNDYAILGTVVSLIKNCVLGVKDGYERKLEIEGVGYKAQLDGTAIVLSLGLTHPVKVFAPQGISFKVEKSIMTINGADKEMVGRIAAEIRAKKPPEPYKGKGIHYLGEVIRKKAGKKAVATA